MKFLDCFLCGGKFPQQKINCVEKPGINSTLKIQIDEIEIAQHYLIFIKVLVEPECLSVHTNHPRQIYNFTLQEDIPYLCCEIYYTFSHLNWTRDQLKHITRLSCHSKCFTAIKTSKCQHNRGVIKFTQYSIPKDMLSLSKSQVELRSIFVITQQTNIPELNERLHLHLIVFQCLECCRSLVKRIATINVHKNKVHLTLPSHLHFLFSQCNSRTHKITNVPKRNSI